MYEPKSEKYNNNKKKKDRTSKQNTNRATSIKRKIRVQTSTTVRKIKTLVQKYKDIKTNDSKKV